MASFFIDTDTGQVATLRQLDESGLVTAGKPPKPWFPIQGTRDATTLWYAVMRKQVRHVHIGALCFRHSDHHASLLQKGWQEVSVEEIGVSAPSRNVAPEIGGRRPPPGGVLDHLKSQGDSCGSAS